MSSRDYEMGRVDERIAIDYLLGQVETAIAERASTSALLTILTRVRDYRRRRRASEEAHKAGLFERSEDEVLGSDPRRTGKGRPRLLPALRELPMHAYRGVPRSDGAAALRAVRLERKSAHDAGETIAAILQEKVLGRIRPYELRALVPETAKEAEEELERAASTSTRSSPVLVSG